MLRSSLLLLLMALVVWVPACELLARVETLRARERALEPESLVWTFRNLAELFPTRTISQGGPVQTLGRRDPDRGPPTMLAATTGLAFDFESFWQDSHVQGLVAVRGDEVVFERYAEGAGPATHFTTWSVAKSIVATLVAAAVHEGEIASLDEPLSTYVPALEEGAYAEVSFRQALQMSSGVRFSERYDDRSTDVFRFLSRSLFTNRESADRLAASFPPGHEPGTHFNYNTAETQLIAWALREATGKSLSALVADKLWAPLDMAHDASWALDREGSHGAEVAGCCLNATLRDWARVGQLHLRRGLGPDGRRLLDEAWVDELAVTQAERLAPGRPAPGSPWGYSTHWWFLPNGAFSARGVYGQYLYVDPEAHMVVAVASAWPEPWGEALDAPVREALAELTRRFGRRDATAPGLPAELAP